MDHYLTNAMTTAQARQLLASFLSSGSEAIDGFLAEARGAGVEANFDMATLPEVILWTLGRMKTTPIEPDMSQPEWIRNTESYKEGLFELTPASKVYVLRAAYYMGECFVRHYPTLSWGTGDQRAYQSNMPVVRGFMRRMEMPPVLIMTNIVCGIIARPHDRDSARVAVESWQGHVGKAASRKR